MSAPQLLRFGRILVSSVLLLSLSTSTWGSSPSETEAAALISAAQQGNLETVKRLLEAGVAVDSQSDYGATPLFFACDKGNLDLVQLLLEKGADPEIQDSFYNATPVEWTLYSVKKSATHRQILLALLDHIAESGEPLDSVLLDAVERSDLETVQRLITKKRVSDDGIRAAQRAAKSLSSEPISELLSRLATDLESIEITEVRAVDLTGDFTHTELDVLATVSYEDGALAVVVAGGSPKALRPKGGGEFGVLGEDSTLVTFTPEEGQAVQFRWVTESRVHTFARLIGTTAESTSEKPQDASQDAPENSDPTPPLPQITRTRPIQWPGFRGEGRNGIADGQGIPTTWNGESSENIAWRTPIPGLGLSSPVIWNDLVFVTTAVSEGGDSTLKTGLYGDVDSVEDDSVQSWKTIAVDRTTGSVLWEREATRGQPKVRRHLKSSHASPTAAVDRDHVVVSFGSAGLFAYDHQGTLLWKKDLGTLSAGWFYDPTYEWEFASSPILFEGKVIVQADIAGESFMAAFDAASGKELWRTERDEISSWGTPVVLPSKSGPDEIITNAKTIRGYDATTGAELWTLAPNSEITVASPVVIDNTAYVTGGYSPVRPIYAIRPGGQGKLDLEKDSTSSATIAWSHSRGGTYIPTPIVYRDQMYILHNNGRLAAYNATTGEEIYKARVGNNESYTASPIAADGRLFFCSDDGTTYVVRAGSEFELLATNELGEIIMASPAASDGFLVLRGDQNLFGITQPTSKPPAGK